MTPRLGFLGVGWIGRHRLDAIAAAGAGTVTAVADADRSAAEAVAGSYGAVACSADDLLAGGVDVDGIVVATPSALHAEQATAALRGGRAVFCQKPLGRTAAECEQVVDAARQADRLLGVDLSYRHLAAVDRIRDVLATGSLGEIYATELVFHNAYGPDKPWFTDPAQSGGGCVIDLGIHLVDLAMWLLDRPKVDEVSARLYRGGRLLDADPNIVEDFATARLDLADGATVTVNCSWFLHAGVDAEIGLRMHGTNGSVALHNVGGSFYDFVAYHRTGTSQQVLAEPPDDWGGRAAVAWADRLANNGEFDPAVNDVVDVAGVLDRIYGR